MQDIASEFEGASLGDARRSKRLVSVAQAAARKPDASFPKIMAGEGELEGTYRFLSNPANDFEATSAPHRNRTVERAVSEKRVLAIHDTTSFQFPHANPHEVGFLNTGKPGFFGHFSLIVSGDGERRPLGVANVELRFRLQRTRGPARTQAQKTAKQPEREYARWEDGVRKTEDALAEVAEVIHVADSEADSFSFLALLHQHGLQHVVRVRHDRRARPAPRRGRPPDAEPWSTLKTLAGDAKSRLLREVPLSARGQSSAPQKAKAHPARETRTAELRFAATTVVVPAPRWVDDALPQQLTMNVVRVYEPKPPAGEEPVEWLLTTTEPIATADDIASIVDIYRTRWVIEEYFKALKTGCIYEERGLETRHALLNALAVFIPIACQLLWLRARARIPEAPATDVLSKTQLKVLRALVKRPLPDQPTAHDVLWAIAGIGGHLKRNGEPGWITIRRGFDDLLKAEAGWAAAKGMRCDQW